MASTSGRSHLWRALSALIVMTAALGIASCAALTPAAPPTPSTAAPDPTTAVLGVYKTILPGASSPGIDGTLYLNHGGSLRQVLDYFNEVPALVEVGTWMVDADGIVTLTIAAQEDRAYDVPIVSRLQHTGHTLVTMPDPDAAEALLTVWYEFGALAAGQVEMPYDAESASMRLERNLAEHYKAFLPSADGCGRDVTLSLQTDGVAVMKTDYLNGEPATEEVGTWELLGSHTLRVTLNSRQDRVYEEPVVTDYVVEEGTLRDGSGVTLRSVFGYVMSVISQFTGETATFADVDEEVLTETALAEAEYDLPDLGPIPLRAGRYEHRYGSGATEVNRVRLQTAGFGDLDGDGADDAAAVLAVATGGSGSFYYVVAMVNRAGELEQAGYALLGDRIQLEYVGVEEGRIVVRMKLAVAGDPMCCPSHTVTQIYRLEKGTLQAVEGP